MPIPYFDLKRQYENLRTEYENTIPALLESGRYVLGENVAAFESEFATFCGTAHGIGVGSGTDALIFALRALAIGSGDEVILPSFTFIATAYAVMHVGAKPVFAEVDEISYTLLPSAIEPLITEKTKAILPVHLYGQSADMKPILELAQKKNLKVVEDACQAHGAAYHNQKVGSLGDAGCFSFYPTKNLGAMGDGGIIVTQDASVAESCRKYRNLGRISFQGLHEERGWTSRLDALQAAILKIKLGHLDQFNQDRRRVAQKYKEYLSETPLGVPEEVSGRYHVYHLFVVRVPNGKRDALQEHLKAKGIGTMVHYPTPLHQQPICQNAQKLSFAFSEQLSREILSLPIFPEMKDSEVEEVSKAVREFYSS